MTHRPRLQGGINAVANAVKVTLGPKGRNVVLQRESFQASVDVGSRWDDDVGMMTEGTTWNRTWTFGGHLNVWTKSIFWGGW